MGAAVACRATQINPACGVCGMVMLAPMISLDKVMHKSVLGPIKNKHLAPIAGLLAFLVPTLPLIAKSDSVLAQQIDKEVRTPPGRKCIRVGLCPLLRRARLGVPPHVAIRHPGVVSG